MSRSQSLQLNSEYSFESSWRDLQDLHLCVLHTFAPLESNLKTTKSHLFKVAARTFAPLRIQNKIREISSNNFAFVQLCFRISPYILQVLSKVHQLIFDANVPEFQQLLQDQDQNLLDSQVS